jgi:para-aminobenzoate synthetase
VRTLLIDNYDSFTYNLFQLLAEVSGAEPLVVRNDEASWEELAGEGFDCVVISPGPGRPERERDFGVCAEAIRRSELPLLGVCLGHQGLGWVHGGQVVRAPIAIHGRASTVEHDGSPLFAGIPPRFEAARYHSLCLRRPLPPDLLEIARSDDGVPMAIAHRFRPQWGVQFHPESIATEHGRRLLANFCDLARAASGARRLAPRRAAAAARGAFPNHGLRKAPRGGDLELRVRRLEGRRDPAAVFRGLYADSPTAFWLDSSRPGPGARFSFMGDASGPLAATVTYDVDMG